VLWSDLDNALAYTSRVDTAAISGTAAGGITALARAGDGLTFTASTFGCAIRVCKTAGAAAPRHYQLPIDGLAEERK
jgi:hypothetical protein